MALPLSKTAVVHHTDLVHAAPAVPGTTSNDSLFDDSPCLSCGLCCAHFRVSFYSGEIAGETGGTVPPEWVSQVGPLRACMKGTEQGGRCSALRGTLGQDGIHCAIYADRSSTCREFAVWFPDGSPNPDCQRLRLAFGLSALSPKKWEQPSLELSPDAPKAA